jgi:serine/threonine protein kinase
MSWLREPNAEPIPGYRLIEAIGSGGFGEVWKCEAPGGLTKAIKFVFGNLNSLDTDSVRAEQELHALQRVKEVRHPFVCSLDRIEIVDGELVIVMELAERTLHDLFLENQAAGMIGIPRDALHRYLRDAAEALDYMNKNHNLQHLDVKPRNLFLIGDRVKVADFGLVKHLERQTASGLLGGVTPLYAPPETFNGKISKTCDQYSLAIVYQELLTGQRPFTGKNVRQLATQHLQGEPDLRSLPETERPIVARALAKDPEQRFSNCMSFLAALYKARLPARIVETSEPPVSKVGVKMARPKTLSETMEDIQLEAMDVSAGLHQVSAAVADPPAVSKSPANDEDNNPMGITQAQPESGAIRPTLIIGVGGFGRKALLELRCRFLDRFGDLHKLPLVRFLCVDTDPEAVNMAIKGAPEVALSRNEVHHLPLQPVGNYRRRVLDHLSEWLPREKLYAMPRSLQTQGSRALGRLAFADNQQRLLARIRRDLQEITHPDTLYRSVTQTGLALRENTPRVYVIAAAGGGNSGMLADLGYALRRQLAQLRHPDARVTCMLFCGAPNDPASPKPELANTYATLTELNHYSDPDIPFAAEYGVDSQRIVDQGLPYQSLYLLPLGHRSPDALDDCLGHLGSYLFHELATPLGGRLEHLRLEDSVAAAHGILHAPIRSFGTYAVWFPRGLLLRMAARHTCRKLIDGWMMENEADLSAAATDAITTFVDKVVHEPGLTIEALMNRIEEGAQTNSHSDLGASPAQALTALLSNLEEQSLQVVAQEDPANWAKQALNRVLDWVGQGGEVSTDLHDWRKTRLSKALGTTAQKLAVEWDRSLSNDLFALMEHEGARVVASETALNHLLEFCQVAYDGLNARISQQTVATAQAWKQVEGSIHECLSGGGGFRIFGGRSKGRQLRTFMEALALFARMRLAEEVLQGVRFFFASLKGKLAERGRDLGFCRQRLRHLQISIESGAGDIEEELANTRTGEYTLTRSPLPSTESYWEAIRQSATARVVLPDGENDLERAALRFLQRLAPAQWTEIDKEIQERVLAPRGGLQGACVNSGDLTRALAEPLMEETAALLGQHLPIMDVAQILSQEFGANGDKPETLLEQTQDYLARSVPLIAGKNSKLQHTFLLVPASPAGKTFGEMIHKVLPDLRIVRVPGQADLMLCREQGTLSGDDLPKLLRPCRSAYETLSTSPGTSPHARFDITDWLPLDP